MKVRYKYPVPEILIKPSVMGIFNYISKNIKTNLVWVCCVRKLGYKYIIEDLYFPEQNVNGFYQCNFDEDLLSAIMTLTMMNDYRPCRFNMIGKFTMEKTTEITDDVMKDFNKVIPIDLDESLVMQLNNKGEMSFGVNRRATMLTDLPYDINMEDFIDIGSLKQSLDSKIGSYVMKIGANAISTATEITKNESAEAEVIKPKSELLLNEVAWINIL